MLGAPPRTPAARRSFGLLVVVLTGLAATGASTLYVAGVAEREQEERFGRLSGDQLAAIQLRLEAYVATLRAARGLFVDGAEPDLRAFQAFTEALELEQRYPGVRGIGYAKLVTTTEAPAVEAAAQVEFPGFRIWPEGEREAYGVIRYLEPLDARNRRAMGFDMLQEPVRREAMTRARDSGEPTASGRVELVQEAGADRQAGFLICAPVRAPEDRGRPGRLLGWIFAPFRVGDLVRATLGKEQPEAFDLEIYDGAEPDPARLLFDARPRRDAEVRARLFQVDAAQRVWTLRFSAGAGFARFWERWLPRFVLAAGLGLTSLLFAFTIGEARALDAAEGAARRAAFLADAGRVLASSLDYPRTLQRVAELAVEQAVDACVVYVDEPGGAPLWLAAHADPRLAAELVEATRASGVDPADGIGPAIALREAAVEVRNDVDPEALPVFRRDPALRALWDRLGARHVLTAPLIARGEPLGAIAFVSAGAARRFDPQDVGMAEDLARLVVAAIDTGRLYRGAQQSLRLRDEFLSIASHELKTPLTSLGLQAESLRVHGVRGPPETIARKAEAIQRNVERLGRLVAAMLDLSRITAGRLELAPEPVDLGELAREVAARFEDEAARAGTPLRVKAQDGIVGSWDRLRLDQVITNLLTNALKYGAGSPVDVRVGGRGGRAFLEVQDRGIGIDEADQARIFERFERAVSERNYGGFGLGLWIVRRIVDAFGGEVSVRSAPGEGATFRVELARGAAGEEGRDGRARVPMDGHAPDR